MAALWMLSAGLLFGCMGVLVKFGAAHFSSNELVFYRSIFSFMIVSMMMWHNRTPLVTSHWRGHAWRGISGTVAMMLFFYCITVLPLATAMTLNYTSALFLTVLTLIVFRDKLHWPLAVCLALGFFGVVLLLHPTLERDQLISGLLGLLSGFLAGVAILNVRELGRAGEPALRVVFYFNLVATLGSGLWILHGTLHLPNLHELPLLLAIGASATFAQLAMTQAYRIGQTMVMSSLSYSSIAFSSLFDLLIWHDALPLAGWFGIALIVASGVLSLRLSPKH
jgi:drug/metabolite transporter (DMT)-like permease